ncbi:MAG: hypothetical protein MZV65_30725 [Chromatiales bacterium]|nr:hypothetical protein [Chromatiales bacterium]
MYRLLQRRFKGRDFLALLQRIIAGFQVAPGKGLPIGSLTPANTFANDSTCTIRKKSA